MATYTYDDYTKRLKESGLNMSDADSRIAQSNPDAGMSLITYKQDFDNATNDSAKALAHANAEEIRRRYGNYSGGADGSGFALVTDNPAYTPNWDNQIANEYQNMQKGFSWSPESDPLTKYYTKAYEREGQRAFDNAIGSLAARTGGQASSYAASAAAQAQNNYMQQLTDKYPELYQQAYNNFLSEYQRHAQNAQAFQSQDNIEYTRYLNDLANERQRRQDQAAADQQAWQNQFAEDQFREQIRQYDKDLTYKYDALDQNERQAAAELAYKYAALTESGEQADEELAYKYAALSQSGQEFVQEMAYRIASMGASVGDYSGLAQYGITPDQNMLNGMDPVSKAKLAAQYGDYSLLEKMGINVPEGYGTEDMTIAEKLKLAEAAANMGDFSFYNNLLGIDTSRWEAQLFGTDDQPGAPAGDQKDKTTAAPTGGWDWYDKLSQYTKADQNTIFSMAREIANRGTPLNEAVDTAISYYEQRNKNNNKRTALN